MKKRGETDWGLDCAEQREQKPVMNIGSRNTEKQIIGTVNSTGRMFALLRDGKLTEDEFYEGLATNAQHIGVSEDRLLELVEDTFLQKA